MRAAEFQHAQLDHKLTELCELLMSAQAQCPDDTGDVAACISDPYRRVIDLDWDHIGKIDVHELHQRPVVCDESGWVLDGNHRVTAARAAGVNTIPVIRPYQP